MFIAVIYVFFRIHSGGTELKFVQQIDITFTERMEENRKGPKLANFTKKKITYGCIADVNGQRCAHHYEGSGL